MIKTVSAVSTSNGAENGSQALREIDGEKSDLFIRVLSDGSIILSAVVVSKFQGQMLNLRAFTSFG